MTLGQGTEIGPFHFTVIRVLVAVGVIRIVIRRELLSGGLNGIDWLMAAWGGWALCSSAFHEIPIDTLIYHLGQVYNAIGIYFLIRCFCQSQEDVIRIVPITAILLVPVALEMLNEQLSHWNLFSVFGGVSEIPAIRNGRLRSQGPFGHAILAGTVGAVCAPLMIGIWRRNPLMAKTGLVACLMMVVTSASSGPLMSLIFSAFALILWRWRHLTRQMRIGAALGYILLALVMKAPPYYLIARIDLAGGSTGWHRARLIQSAFEHLGEWWLAGTDYTRHWMPTGVSWSPNHADITSQYIAYGVLGGLPLMLLFIAAVCVAFQYVGKCVVMHAHDDVVEGKFVWAFGASLFANAASCVSVSYFDQSFIFLFLNLAAIGSIYSVAAKHYVGVE
ncbi:hypothetical protein C4565_05190 [Candidatus Parcubacteria bacterium]|nr:MAG: hypothetical protein C4565_05190 [Candidatus Parcubacteria bacterium]